MIFLIVIILFKKRFNLCRVWWIPVGWPSWLCCTGGKFLRGLVQGWLRGMPEDYSSYISFCKKYKNAIVFPSLLNHLSSSWWGGAGGGIASTAGRSCSCGYWGGRISWSMMLDQVSIIRTPAPAWQAGMALLPGLAGLLAHQPQRHLLLRPHLNINFLLN